MSTNRILYNPLSQYTINQLLEPGDIKYAPQIPSIFAHLDRFPNETVDSLNDLFTTEAVDSFIELLINVDMLHLVMCKTIEDKLGEFLVIAEYLYGDDYKEVEINGIKMLAKVCTEHPTGVMFQRDYYKTRDVAYDYEAIQPKRNIIDALKRQQEQLVTKVQELLKRTKDKAMIEEELRQVQLQNKSIEENKR